MRIGIALLMSTVVAMACTDLRKEGGKDEGQDATAAARPAACEGETCDAAEKPAPQTEGLGLAAFCSYAGSASGQGCFTCTPRELPRRICVPVPAGFDPAAQCQHDLDRLTCDLGAAAPLVIEFADRSPDEDLYERLPLLIFAAKALLLQKIESKPELRDLIFNLLDSVDRHKLALFTGGDVGPVVDDAKPLLMVAKPDLTDAQLDAVKALVKTAAADFAAKRVAGPISYADVFAVLTATCSALPPELVGDALQDPQVAAFLKALAGKSGDELLQELSKTLGGEAALGDVAAQLGALGD